jgi:hypothetical protein
MPELHPVTSTAPGRLAPLSLPPVVEPSVLVIACSSSCHPGGGPTAT